MPDCPVEWSDEVDAEWLEYKPRMEPDGRSFGDELTKVKGTRRELMAYLAKCFADWSPHDWIDRWAAHQRQWQPMETRKKALQMSNNQTQKCQIFSSWQQ